VHAHDQLYDHSDRCAAQVGSNDDNSSGGGYAYRASKAALNISASISSPL